MNDIYDVLEHVLYANKGVLPKKIQEIMFMTYGYSYEDTRRAQEVLRNKPNTRIKAEEKVRNEFAEELAFIKAEVDRRDSLGVELNVGKNYWVAGLNSTTPQDWDAVRPDMVNSPPHYTKGGIETIDFIQAKLSPEEYRGYLRGNLLKYASRMGAKGEDDAGKAAWYADRLSKCGC